MPNTPLLSIFSLLFSATRYQYCPLSLETFGRSTHYRLTLPVQRHQTRRRPPLLHRHLLCVAALHDPKIPRNNSSISGKITILSLCVLLLQFSLIKTPRVLLSFSCFSRGSMRPLIRTSTYLHGIPPRLQNYTSPQLTSA